MGITASEDCGDSMKCECARTLTAAAMEGGEAEANEWRKTE